METGGPLTADGRTRNAGCGLPSMPNLADAKINLDNYYGPLDLLLHLVKADEVDITAIALARACEQYIAFLSAMEKLDINLSADFLALASQLLLIKSRTLAPPEVAPGEEIPPGEEEEDTSAELIRKLLEFKRFKDRARLLGALAEERARRHGRPPLRLEGETEPEPLRNLELWDLVLLFSRVTRSTQLEASLSILYRDIPLEVFIEKILRGLERNRAATFSQLLSDPRDRSEVVGTFLALLQLSKDGKIRLDQPRDTDEIRVELAVRDPDAAAAGPAPPESPPPPREPEPPPTVPGEATDRCSGDTPPPPPPSAS